MTQIRTSSGQKYPGGELSRKLKRGLAPSPALNSRGSLT
jgi:hypothetical protein